MATPESPDVWLSRESLAAALKERGFTIESSTLATMATRGGGPPYKMFGRRARYHWGRGLKWAENRLSAPRRKGKPPSSTETKPAKRRRARQQAEATAS